MGSLDSVCLACLTYRACFKPIRALPWHLRWEANLDSMLTWLVCPRGAPWAINTSSSNLSPEIPVYVLPRASHDRRGAQERKWRAKRSSSRLPPLGEPRIWARNTIDPFRAACCYKGDEFSWLAGLWAPPCLGEYSKPPSGGGDPSD